MTRASRDHIAIKVDHVSSHYTLGATTTHAVDDVSFGIDSLAAPARENPRFSISWPASIAQLRAQSRPMAGNLAELSPTELDGYRRDTVGIVFQSFNLLPRMALAENVELPLRLAEVDRAERFASRLAVMGDGKLLSGGAAR
jgi:hypothetical protein